MPASDRPSPEFDSQDVLDRSQGQSEQRVLEVLASLSYRTDELKVYLQKIACGVNELMELDWSVVTLCQNGSEQVLASTIELLDVAAAQSYSLHGTVTGTVVETGCPLIVEDITINPTAGKVPEGYRAYLGVPLLTLTGEVIGTICSFHQQPRCFTAKEVRLAELFAERAATAIDNYNLYQQQRQFNQVLEAEVTRRTQELLMAQVQVIEANNQLEVRIEQRTAELRQLNEQLQAEIRERQQAQQAMARLAEIGELATMIVHEVRNPLTTVLMGLTALQGIDIPEKAQIRLALALDDAERLQRLLNEILLYAKQQVLQCSNLELNTLTSNLIGQLQNTPEIAERRIKFVPSLSSAWILGDRDKLKQVLINLIKNACEAVASGDTITCSIELTTINSVCISVHNHGEPIPVELLAKLGTPFLTTKPSGNGLGLAIVRRIVEAHEGELSIQSTTQTGTIVSVHFPLIKVLFPTHH